MSLREKIDAYIIKKAAKDRCGIWPIQFPKSIPFTSCCATHDQFYVKLRTEALELAKKEGIELISNTTWLKTQYKKRLLGGDLLFYNCMEDKTKVAPAYKKLFYWPMAKTFSLFVKRYGWLVWARHTIDSFLESNG